MDFKTVFNFRILVYCFALQFTILECTSDSKNEPCHHEKFPPESSTGNWHAIRIKTFYTDKFYDDTFVSNQQRSTFRKNMEVVVNHFQHLLHVNNTADVVLTDRICGSQGSCGKESDACRKKIKTNADLVIFVKPGQCSSSTLALAKTCDIDKTGRPIVGEVSLCVVNLNIAKWNQPTIVATLRHELLHVLALGANLGKHSKRVHRTWRINSEKVVQHEVTLVNTPCVKEFVRRHFDCPDLEGAELENDGSGGTRGVHWEKRLFGVTNTKRSICSNGPEIMTGLVSRRTYLSNLTLSYLHDSLFYRVNYSMSEDLVWGKGHGCLFAKGSCREYMDSQENVELKASPYCNWADYVEKRKRKAVYRRCSADRATVTRCDWAEKEKVMNNHTYFYFSDKTAIIEGESVSGYTVSSRTDLTDNCPMWTDSYYGHSETTDRRIGDSVCMHSDSQPPFGANWGAEIHGHNSICIEQDGKFEIFECRGLGFTLYQAELAFGAGCYKYKCYQGRLMIQANYSDEPDDQFMRAYKVCWGFNNRVMVRRHQYFGENNPRRFHKGDILCPHCHQICENNPAFPDFKKCAPDIKIDSVDFTRKVCPMYANRSNQSGLPRTLESWMILWTVIVLLLKY